MKIDYNICEDQSYHSDCVFTLSSISVSILILTTTIFFIIVQYCNNKKFRERKLALFMLIFLLFGSICEFITRWIKYYIFSHGNPSTSLIIIKAVAEFFEYNQIAVYIWLGYQYSVIAIKLKYSQETESEDLRQKYILR